MKKFIYEEVESQYDKEGYVVVPDMISLSSSQDLLVNVKKMIGVCARELGCSTEEYLSVVNRWAHPSPVTSQVTRFILDALEEFGKNVFKVNIELKEIHLICKTSHAVGPIPLHQDIAYAVKDPYHFSIWMPLNTVPSEAGSLKIIPKSHQGEIKPAVDFWSPDFDENTFISELFPKSSPVVLSLNVGDVVLFSSKLWHGSSTNKLRIDRYALVTRWKIIEKRSIPNIQRIQPQFFGMWTCQKETEDLLKAGCMAFLHEQKQGFSFIDLLNVWIEDVLPIASTSFSFDILEALDALKKVKVLHLAHMHHRGSNASGIIYKNLWRKLLFPLKNYLSQQDNDS